MKKLFIAATAIIMIASCNGAFQKQGPCEPSETTGTMMLDGPGSVMPDKVGDETRERITKEVTEMVKTIYEEVNHQWRPDYVAGTDDATLEEVYCTEGWQRLYDKVMEVQSRQLEKDGNDENAFFAEGANCWTMGSYDAPFTPNDIEVTALAEDSAFVSFYLMPAESEGCKIGWAMIKDDGQWAIDNFFLIIEDEGADDHRQLMKAYIEKYE